MPDGKIRLEKHPPRLDKVDLERKLKDEETYERRLKALQIDMLNLQQAYQRQGRRGIIVLGQDVSPAQLRAEIAKVRQQGWASVPNQYQVGLNAVSAPIFGADGKLVASIAILGLIPEVPAVPPAEMVNALRAAAARISGNLGWRGEAGR